MTVALEERATAARTAGRLLAGLTADGSVGLMRHRELWGPLSGLAAAALIAEIDAAGLLGRGGAGFPVARKLSAVAAGSAKSGGGPAVIVANGCEGEPASAKDTMLLARVPHLVLDGIQLAARAVRADRAYLVVHTGSAAIPYLRAALAERGREAVPVTLETVPPRYVASEESALVSWLNGGDAVPAYTPPRPFERGVNRRPTLISNVESLAHVATIIRRGAEWFRGMGDASEPGTMLVSVSGQQVERRVAEVATGTTIGRVITAAGLSLHGSSAVLVGGYFGSWLPADEAARLPLTHGALRDAGVALGAGVLAVLPPESCGIAETARVVSYLAASSARQCGPCLNGLPAIAGAMNALAAGTWDERTWPALGRWLDVVPGRGACRHPDGTVRLVASALSTFAADVERHRAGRPCEGIAAVPFLPIPAVPRSWDR
jgi:NADH:ubiquinone oxidoreductase subunit F (NADH-binding)